MASAIDGAGYSDNVVLVRCWWQTRAIEDAFLRAKVPYVVVDGPSFYQRREVKDMMAYMRLAIDPDNDEALRRIFNVPNRYLGKAAMAALEAQAERRQMSLAEVLRTTSWPQPGMREGANQLTWILENLRASARSEGPCKLLETIIARTGYLAWLAKEQDHEDREENIRELIASAAEFASLADMLFYAQQVEHARSEDADAVQVMTIHKAKGKEFRYVWVVGCAEGIMPHARSDDLEEERRIAYVAMTRAEDALTLTTSTTYRDKPHEPSRFLAEAGLELPELPPLDLTEGVPELVLKEEIHNERT